ncbi:hypothetical protein FA15DRAFT_645112 [Coprinopsis marcescibilis]|uniref:Uncharacterized protein n=1 Tax=Coprinopsis marcescibilis TaxID=230819 RepID=A0A5C3KNB3_COPMA|nr:hypothetical protein FA15DRAFT_645112 [Coprinopsis marcescibilis]
MTVSATCQICYSTYPLEKFRILPCGESAAKDLVSRGVFLEIVESRKAFTTHFVEGMSKMDESAAVGSVRKAVEKMDKGAKVCKGDAELLAQLLSSTEDFKTRVIPMFEKARTHDEELETVRREIREEKAQKVALQEQLARAYALLNTERHDNSRIRAEAAEAEKLANEVTLAAEEVKDKWVKLQEEHASYRKIASDLDADKRRIADQRDRNAAAARSSKDKCRALKQQVSDLQKQLELAQQRQQYSAPASPVARPPQPQDYEGDFLNNESGTSRYLLKRLPVDENSFEVEGIARPLFSSDWNLEARGKNVTKNITYGLLKKARPVLQTHRRVTNPLRLDSKGHPTTAIQVGPKRTVKV